MDAARIARASGGPTIIATPFAPPQSTPMRPATPSAARDDQHEQRPSKTQLKQQMHELQELGLALTTLPAERLRALGLPERLSEAIDEFKRTRSHDGRRRQLQFIGKLMRGI